MEPVRPPARQPAIRSLFGAANWNSFSSSAVLEPPPSRPPASSFSLRPLFSVPVRWFRRRPRPRLPFLRPMQPTMQQVWVGSPALSLSLPLPLLVICKVDGSIL